MSSVEIAAGKHGPRAVLHAPWSGEAEEAVRRAGARELELNLAKGWRGSDLSFLARIPPLLAIEVLDGALEDDSGIHAQRGLRSIHLDTYAENELRLDELPDLESVSLNWRRKAQSLFRCVQIRELHLNGYDAPTAAQIGVFIRLESLALMSARFQDLRGFEPLAALRRLRLGNCRKLRSLDGIEGLAALEELEVNTAPRLGSIEALAGLSRLRKLDLNDCGRIPSLAPIANLSQLEHVVFYGSTCILDGDLSPLAALRRLRRTSFMDRKHYSHRRDEFG